MGFLEGFEQAPAHRLEYRTIQGFLVEERIAVRFQRTFQIFNAYDPARTQQDGAVNHVPKLTHISRPIVAAEHGLSFRGNAGYGRFCFIAKLADEVPD